MTLRFFSRVFIVSFFSIICISTAIVNARNFDAPSLVQVIPEAPIEQIQGMIANGANVNEKNSLGWTPLHAAVNFAKIDIVRSLLDKQADVNAQDNAGKTPLYMAVESGQMEMVKLLINAKANLDITANNGQNALSLAQAIGLNKIAAELEQNGANMPAPQETANQETQENPNSRRGRGNNPQPGQMPGNMGPRRGLRGNQINSNLNNPEINPVAENPEQPGNVDTGEVQSVLDNANNITLDPNEVKARLQKFDGLEKAVQTVANSSRIGMRQWSITDEDNKARLITAERSQFEDELAFIKKTAEEEKAKKTSEAVDKLLSDKKERYIIAAREVKNQTDLQARQNRATSTASRRSTRGTTATTRSTRRGAAPTVTGVPTTGTTTQTKETNYSPEVQGEVDIWLNATVTNITGRLSLMDTVNEETYSELNSLKLIASEEKAEKTEAAIDGLISARQQRYDAVKKELEKLNQQQGTTMMPVEIPGPTGIRGQMPEAAPMPVQPMSPPMGRGRRG
jgi:hypothetical protein